MLRLCLTYPALISFDCTHEKAKGIMLDVLKQIVDARPFVIIPPDMILENIDRQEATDLYNILQTPGYWDD